MPKDKETVEVILERRKEGKWVWKYDTDNGTAPFNTLYVQKAVLREMGDPTRIVVSIRPAP